MACGLGMGQQQGYLSGVPPFDRRGVLVQRHRLRKAFLESGEIVFVAILGGVGHPVGAFIGAAIFEFVKLFAAAYLTGAWQMVLGIVLIAMVFLAPRGISALLEKKRGEV